MSGETPWGEHASYGAIARRFWQGSAFKVTQTSEQFGWDELREQNPGGLFLFFVHQDRIGVIRDTAPPTGAKVIYLPGLGEGETPRAEGIPD